MMRITEESNDIVTIEASGKLTREDYDRVIPALEQKIASQGTINAMIKLDNFQGISFEALRKELSFDTKNYDNFKRVAIVSESSAAKVGELFGKLFSVEVKQFDEDESATARQWLATN